MNTSDSAISRHTLPKPKRRWVWLVVLAAVGLAVLGILYFGAQVPWRDAEQFLSDHRSSLRMDSTRLILAASRAGFHDKILLLPDVLPASLRPPGVQYAEIKPDRITLVLYASPDTTSGFRVWVDKPAEGFQDAPTSISFVTRFRYCNDYPKSPLTIRAR